MSETPTFTKMDIALAFLILFTPHTAYAQSQAPIIYNASTSEAVVRSFAVKYGIDGEDFLQTMKNESGLRADAKGDFVKGKPTSFGVAQIHITAHTDITKEQALNPFFALDWSAQQFKAGKQSMWTGWCKMHQSKCPWYKGNND